MNIARRSAFVAIGLVALGSSLLGCGSTSGATQADSNTGLAKVTVGNFPTSALTLPFAVAQDQGFFGDAGLDVETVKAKSGPELLAGLIGGTTQIAVAVPPNAFPAMQQGEPLIALPPFGRLDMAVVAPSTGGISDISALAGKKIGVTARGAFTEKFAQYVLQAKGIKPDQVTFVAVGDLVSQELALKHNQIDATVFSSDAVAAAGAHGIDLRVLAGSLQGTAGQLGEVGLQSFWATTTKFRESNPDVVKNFCTAMTKANTWLQDNTNRAAGTKIIETLLNVPAPVAGEVWDGVHTAWSDTVTSDRWSANVKLILGSADSLPFDKFVSGCTRTG